MGKIISEFVAFKSKTYSLTHIDNEENKKKAKQSTKMLLEAKYIKNILMIFLAKN